MLFLLLSLTVTNAVANNWTNETTVEYWVRPDNMLSCPSSIPSHAHCVTITDLVYHSLSINIEDFITVNVVFLSGTHVPKKGGLIVAETPSTGQQILLGANLIGLQNVLIDCESGEPISFVFINIFSFLMIKNIKLLNCGFELKKQVVALTVANVPELLIENVSIFKSRGVGMVVNITDQYTPFLIVLNRIFIDNSYGQNKNTYEGNLYIELSTMKLLTAFSNITVTDSIISNGHCSCSDCSSEQCTHLVA